MGMDVIGDNGDIFCTSIWEWRALCLAIELSGHELPESWRGNSGHGLSWQEECDFLADHLQKFLLTWDEDRLFADPHGIFVDAHGRFVDPGTPNAVSAYSVTRAKLESFIDFLRICDGFAIY